MGVYLRVITISTDDQKGLSLTEMMLALDLQTRCPWL